MTSAKICATEERFQFQFAREREERPTHEHEDHCDKDATLQEVSSRARVADDADSLSRCQPGQTTRQSRREVDTAGVERVRFGRVEGADDEDADDESVDGDDAGHDDGDERLHDEVGAEGAHPRDPDPGFRRPVRSAQGCRRAVALVLVWSLFLERPTRTGKDHLGVRGGQFERVQVRQSKGGGGGLTAAPTPANPKKGAYAGHASVAIAVRSFGERG
jgi:hypothetical protein